MQSASLKVWKESPIATYNPGFTSLIMDSLTHFTMKHQRVLKWLRLIVPLVIKGPKRSTGVY